MKAFHQKQEHTNSYYAATVNEVTDYPVLDGGISADICVVGAGFTGVATALTLAERGFSVALVEANRIGWGASGRNGGQLINGISGLAKIQKKYGDGIADMLWDLRWRGNDIIHDWVAKYGIECNLKDGFIETALKPRHLSNLTFPAGSYIVGTEPLSDEMVAEINPLDLAVCDLNEVVDYYRLSADKRMLFGGRCNYSGREPASIKAAIVPRMLKIYPQLKNVRIDYEWGGTMEKFDLFADMKHFRIPGSQWIGNQIIALGMLYFRLKDRL